MHTLKETARVQAWLIRDAVETDAAALYRYDAEVAGEAENNIGIRDGAMPESVDATRALIQRYHGRTNSRLLVVSDPAGAILGQLRLTAGATPLDSHVVTLSINVHPRSRGLGLGSQLLGEALRWVRLQASIRRIQLTVLTRNEPAIRLFRRFGFLVEGTLRHACYLREEDLFADALIMAYPVQPGAAQPQPQAHAAPRPPAAAKRRTSDLPIPYLLDRGPGG